MDMFHFKKHEHTDNILAPVAGTVIELSKVSDPVFAQKMMGEGFAITPDTTNDQVVAPVDGVVTVAQDHAFGIQRDDGLEFLVHVGIDTVNLKGAPFVVHIKQGKQVHAGEKLITVDWSMISQNNLDDTVMVLITNSKTNMDQFQVNYGEINQGAVAGSATVK